jgi:hypothetical protein
MSLGYILFVTVLHIIGKVREREERGARRTRRRTRAAPNDQLSPSSALLSFKTIDPSPNNSCAAKARTLGVKRRGERKTRDQEEREVFLPRLP